MAAEAEERWDLDGEDAVEVEINEALGEDKGDSWEFPATFAASGVRKGKWRPHEEMARSAPFHNGLPIIEGHPFRTAAERFKMAVPPLELVRGITHSAYAVHDDAKGVTKVKGIMQIFKRNPKTGASHDSYINKLRAGKVRKVSISFQYEPGPEDPNHRGMETETFIRPLNLGTLEGDTPAACELDACGVGVNDNCDCPELLHPDGVEDMPMSANDENKPEGGKPPAQAPAPAMQAPAAPQLNLGALNVESIARENPEVQRLIAEKKAAEARLAEVAEKEKRLAEYEAKEAAAKAKEKEALEKEFEEVGRQALGSDFDRIYTSEARKEMTTCEMGRARDALKTQTEARTGKKAPPASPTLRPPSSAGQGGSSVVTPDQFGEKALFAPPGKAYDPTADFRKPR